MNISTVKGLRIEAIAACVPSNIVDNHQFAKEHFSEDMSATIKALGIERRHVCAHNTTTAVDMCVSAAEKIFASGVDKNDIGAIVFVTQTPDMLMPNNASFAHYRLGLPADAFSFDINHACSGYICGLWNASVIASNLKKKVLLLDGDTNSHYVSPCDKATGLLFGDGGTATVIAPSEGAPDWHFALNTDGNEGRCVTLGIGFKNQLKKESLDYITYEDGSKRRAIDMYMDGLRVFDYAIHIVPKVVNEFMDELETSAEDYDRLIPHQANDFMLRKIAKKIGFPKEKMSDILKDFGNSSSVCIPLIISIEKNLHTSHALIYSIGAGMTTGVGDICLDTSINNLGLFEEDF